MEIVVPGVGNPDMEPGYFLLLFLPVGGKLDLSGEFSLFLGKFLLKFFKTVQRFQKGAIRYGCEPGDTHVNPHGGSGGVDRLRDLPLGLDRDVPVIAPPGHCEIPGCPFDLPALDEPDPANLGQKDPASVQLEALRIPEGICVLPFFLNRGNRFGFFLSKASLRAWSRNFKVCCRVCDCAPARNIVSSSRFQPVRSLATSTYRKTFSPALRRSFCKARALFQTNRQHPACCRKRDSCSGLAFSLYLYALRIFMSHIILWSMMKNNDIRTGRHCVFNMHVHLVFVTKYRKKVLDGKAIEILRESFAKICSDFEAELIEFNGEHDHVHLLVHYPPKVAISAMVNSLKGASSRLLRNHYPEIAGRYYKNVLWSPSYFAASCGGAPISIIRQYVEQQQTPD